MARLEAIFVILCIVHVSNCASVHKGERCGIHDNDCQKRLYEGVIRGAAESGIPDIDVPVLDPYVHKNAEVTIMDLIKIKTPEVIIKGLRTCRTVNYHLDIEKKLTTAKYNCELMTAEGKYQIESTPVLSALIGNIKIHGDGFGTFKIENLEIDVEVPFLIKKLDDGELYFMIDGDKIILKFDVGKATLTADSLFVGSQDVSTVAVNIVNENSQFFLKAYAEKVIRLGINVFTENANKFLSATPVKDIIIEDLSAYVTQ